MKTNAIAFSAASVLFIAVLLIGIFKVDLAAALTATTTDTTSATTTASAPPTDVIATATSSTASTTASAAPITQTVPAITAPSLKLVHRTGTKYVDYFTDGTKTYSFPGDPAVDSKFNQPNAPIPSHKGLTWVSTSGMEAYDTSSGDLDIGDYAQEADGSFIVNTPTTTYTDATSSVAIPAHITLSKTDPTLAGAAQSSAVSTATTTTTASTSAQ